MYFDTLISVHNRKRFFRFVFIMGTAMNYSFQSMIRRGMSKGRISLKIMKRSLKLFVLGIILNTNWGREYGLHNTKYICIDVTKPQLPTMRDIISNCYRNKSCGSSMEPIEMVSCMVQSSSHVGTQGAFVNVTYVCHVFVRPVWYTGKEVVTFLQMTHFIILLLLLLFYYPI